MDDENNEKKNKGSWIQSTANFFVIIEAVINIVSHLTHMYHVYQEHNKHDLGNENMDAGVGVEGIGVNDGVEGGEVGGVDLRVGVQRNNIPEQGRSPAFPLNPPEDIETEIENDACKICMTNKIRTINLPCGHMVFCFACCRNFVSNNFQHDCPMCRAKISEIKIVYN